MCVLEGVVEIQSIATHEEPFQANVDGPDGSCKRVGNSIYCECVLSEPKVVDDDYKASHIIQERKSIDIESFDEKVCGIFIRQQVVNSEGRGVIKYNTSNGEKATIVINITHFLIPALIGSCSDSRSHDVHAIDIIVDGVTVLDVIVQLIGCFDAHFFVKIRLIRQLHVEHLIMCVVNIEKKCEKAVLGVVTAGEQGRLDVPSEAKGIVYRCIPNIVRQGGYKVGIVQLHLTINSLIRTQLGNQ